MTSKMTKNENDYIVCTSVKRVMNSIFDFFSLKYGSWDWMLSNKKKCKENDGVSKKLSLLQNWVILGKK